MQTPDRWTAEDASRFVRAPTDDDSKYTRGVVGLVTGSERYPGAAILSVSGAWRAGAGFVRWLGPQCVQTLVLQTRPETVFEPGRVDAWVFGPGADDTSDVDLLEQALHGSAPVVVDASMMSNVSSPSAPTLLTPHAGEFAKLQQQHGLSGGTSDDDVIALAAETGAHVLLKGSETRIASPAGSITVVASGTAWLATAGTGDVLAGVLGTVIAQNSSADLLHTAATGAWLHAAAGKHAAGAETGVGRPIVASDVSDALPAVIERIVRAG